MEAAKQTAEMSQSRKAGHLTNYKVHALHVDVRDEDGVQQMVDEATSLFGRIDYFVNTAGVSLNIIACFHTLELSRLHFEMQSCITLLALLYKPHIPNIVPSCSLAPPVRKKLPQCHSRTTGVWMKSTT